MSKAKHNWTEREIFDRLRKKFPPPSYELIPQCRSAVGAETARTADALGVSTWLSNGLYFFGIEIKVTRSDWRKELTDPGKAEAISRYCRHWYVAAPKDVVPPDELPPNWGLLEVTQRGVRTTKHAPDLEPQPPSLEFICAILRASAAATIPAIEIQTRINAAVAAAEEKAEKDASRRYKRLQRKIEIFEKASGVSIAEAWAVGDIGAAVKAVQRMGVLGAIESTRRLREIAEGIVEQTTEALAASDKAKPERNEP